MADQQNRDEHDDLMHRLRHSAAHVMAEAVLQIYPNAKIAIGPAIENGFYYDFDLGTDEQGRPRTFTPEDLQEIERRMRKIIGGRHPFESRAVSADEARQLFKDQPYKIELIEGLAKGGTDEYGNETDQPVVISTYRHDTFEDLCRGPHLEHTGQIPPDAFKLMSVAGAYWRGDEHNPMLQRIYGTAWRNKKDLAAHIKDLEIFIFDDEIGPGLPLWLPNGGVMIEALEDLAKQMEYKMGYQRVRTPHLSKEDLFLHSGHLPYYSESMYPPMELEGVRYSLPSQDLCHQAAQLSRVAPATG
jgi:threonyl-tRNA synthetase